MYTKILNKLPGFNCGNCGCSRCDEFAKALLNKNKKISDCPTLLLEKNAENRKYIINILSQKSNNNCAPKKITGLIDNYEADIILEPLAGEHSCREVLFPMSNSKLHVNDIVKYRPLGCPITHFAKIIEVNNLLISVHIIGPCNRSNNNNSIDVGVCMVIAFEGKYTGKDITVGDTVRFLPNHCMMQKVHSGVIVNIDKNNIIIEGIDLKVWEAPKKILE